MFLARKTTENKPSNSELISMIGLIKADIVELKAEINRLDQYYKTLQGKVNRRLGEVAPSESTETNKIDDGFDFLRKNGNI